MAWMREKWARIPEAKAVARALTKAMGIALRESPGYAVLMVLSRALAGALPLVMLWTSKMVIDGVVDLSATPVDLRGAFDALAPFLFLYLFLVVFSEVGASFGGLSRQTMSDKIVGRATTLLMGKVSSLPGLAPFETSEFHDALRNARDGIATRPAGVLQDSLYMITGCVTSLGATVIIWNLHPLAFLLVLAATLPSLRVTNRLFWRMADVFRGQATDARMLRYLARLATGDEPAVEARLYGLSGHFLHRYRALAEGMFKEMFVHNRRHVVHGSLATLVESACMGIAYGFVVYRAIDGQITIGDLSMYAGAIFQLQRSVGNLVHFFPRSYEHGVYLKHFFDFLEREPSIATRTCATPSISQADRDTGIEVRNVSFKYPGTDTYVLRNLDLNIRPAETVALVGANGSGKTTLVKLLTRLYDPIEGEILLNGVDLREYDIDEFRANIAAIFQDFCAYHMKARDNIAFGRVEQRDTMEAIRVAAERGQAAALVESLPNGYETMLGKRFDGGVDLSGGEWQKIALSRAFMRDSGILILDEPSAALDVETEYEIYRRSAELTEGRMTILISHRFTTVRMADRMVVLEGGRIVEDGTHKELISRDGLYAEMFNAQAERYR